MSTCSWFLQTLNIAATLEMRVTEVGCHSVNNVEASSSSLSLAIIELTRKGKVLTSNLINGFVKTATTAVFSHLLYEQSESSGSNPATTADAANHMSPC